MNRTCGKALAKAGVFFVCGREENREMQETNISGHKMMANLERVLMDHRPITADVFLTNYCNNRCPYCTYGRWDLINGAKAMGYQEFKIYAMRLIELGVRGIILTDGGEPTVAPEFQEIANWLTGRGI